MSDMDEKLRQVQGSHFLASLNLLVEWRSQEQPHVSDLQQLTIIPTDEEERLTCIQEWHHALSAELNPKTVRYATAIRRITGTSACAYHALAYRDVAALNNVWETIPWIASWQMDVLLTSDSRHVWELLNQMADFSKKFYKCIVKIPSRDEISANITRHRASRQPPKPAMTRGFDVAFDEITTLLGVTVDARSSGLADRAGAWTQELENKSLSQIITDKNTPALKTFAFKHECFSSVFRRVSDNLTDESFWSKLRAMNSFAGVQNAIPNNMMSKIESTAHKLAGEIAAGKTDMSQLNIADIGKSVLQGVDPGEMEQFSQNMSSLLPLLNNLQGTMMSQLASNTTSPET